MSLAIINRLSLLKKYSWVVNLIGIAIISYIVADISGQFILNKSRQYLPITSSANHKMTKQRRGSKNIAHYYKISDKNIFNKAILTSTETDKYEPDIAHPLSPLNFRLTGTIVRNGKGFMAFLENKGSKIQKIYKVGDNLKPGATIAKIGRDSVTINRNGKLEVIKYPSSNIPYNGSSLSPKRGLGNKKTSGVRGMSENSWVIDKRYMDNKLSDMSSLLRQVRAVPQGKEGFKLLNIRKGSIFEQIGLNNGDILKRVNGVDLSSPENAIEVYQQLQGISDIEVDIVRNGSPHTFKYSIE